MAGKSKSRNPSGREPGTEPGTSQRKEGWRDIFLASLEQRANVGRACKMAGVARGTAYQARRENPDFKERWDQAIEAGLDHLEDCLQDIAEDYFNKSAATAAMYLLNVKRYKRRSTQMSGLLPRRV